MTGPIVVFSPATLDFGVRAVSTEETRTIQVTNTGDTEFTFPVRPGLTFTPATVPVGPAVDVAVKFRPLSTGSFATRVFVPVNAAGAEPVLPGSVLAIAAHGAILQWTPATIVFGDIPVGDVGRGYIDIRYDAGSAAAAAITGYTPPFSGPGAVASATSPTRVLVQFVPTAVGPFSVTVTLASSAVAGATSATCVLSGSGIADTALVAHRAAALERERDAETQARDELAAVHASPAGGSQSGKYWELELDHTADGQTFNSYLRIGSAEPNPVLLDSHGERNGLANPEDRRGHDLAAMIVGFHDDKRFRGQLTNALFPLVTDREQESGKLHTRGGWRDHSDGNRITTTRGDKIEIIQGNSQLLVLGRNHARGDGARWESSGGHLVGDAEMQTFGAVLEVRFENHSEYGDCWKIISETLKGDAINRFHGDVENYFFGKKQKNYVGSPTPDAPLPANGTVGDPAGSGTTNWLTSGSGDSKQLQPVVENRTWAESINSETSTKSLKETTTVSGMKWSHTIVKPGAGYPAFAWNTTSVAGLLLEMTNAILHVTENASPLKMDISIGAKLSIALAYEFKISKDASNQLVVNNGAIHLKSTVTKAEETELKLKETQIAAEKTEMNTKITSLQGDVTALQTKNTTIVTSFTQLSTSVNVLAAQVNHL